MSFSEWSTWISRTYAQPYNNCLIAPACMCTFCIVRYLMSNIGISLKGRQIVCGIHVHIIYLQAVLRQEKKTSTSLCAFITEHDHKHAK